MSSTAKIFDIQRWSLHDGPGIRTVVFFKGCPLRCLWCSNPESQEVFSEIAYFQDKCIACGRCVGNCPYGAISQTDVGINIDHNVCAENCYSKRTSSFPCTKQCYSGAIKTFGEDVSVDDVFNQVNKEKKLFTISGGGITLSGGEPLMQWRFALELLKRCKENGISTAIETSGYSDWAPIESLLPYLDIVLYDIKHTDAVKHKDFIGRDNTLILENAEKISRLQQKENLQMIIRVPVIPDFNSTEEDIHMIAKYVKTNLEDIEVIDLLPYHRLGRNKYTCLGKTYELYDLEPLSEGYLGTLKEIVAVYGFKTDI